MPQVDLSSDEEVSKAVLESSLTHNQLLIERVICKTFAHHRCDVIISDHLRSLFTNKIFRMGKTMHALGGRGRAKQLEQWKETNWTINLNESEIVPKSRKRKAENVFIQSQIKKIAVLKGNLEDCQQSLKAAHKQIKKAEESSKSLSQSLNHISKHNKSWSEYSAQYQRKQKRQIASDVCTALKFTENGFYKASRIELINKETNEILSVSQDGSVIKSEKPRSTTDDSDAISKQTLYVKEKFNISNTAYQELSMIHPPLPRWCALNKISKQIDSSSTIRPTPGPMLGVQQSLTQRLKLRLEYLVKMYPSIKEEPLIRVKITGDGTKVSRSMHILVIAFTILVGLENPNSPCRNHVIAMLNSQENYEHLSEAVKDIANEIELTKSITIEGHKFNIEYFLGADMKFLAICLGIEAANATYLCIWCKCPAADRHNTSNSWCSIEDGARTVEEIQKLALEKKRGLKYGCIQQPLFPAIPVDHVVPDILHLFLRISDVLVNLLILDLRTMDAIEKCRSTESKQATSKNLDKYITYLNENCKICFHMYVDKESKNLKWRDLTGPEKLKLLKSIKIAELFPNLQKAQEVQQLWEQFKKSMKYFGVTKGLMN